MSRTSTKQSSTRSGAEKAHEALLRHLNDGKYWERAALAVAIQKDGHTQRISYVMTKARQQGGVVVLGPNKGTYTSRPSGVDALKDLRKRRKTSIAYLRNAQGEAAYVVANWNKIAKRLDDDVAEELKGEVDFVQKMVPHVDVITKRAGLA